MLRVNNKLWLISDTHFGHKNIIKFQQRPETHEEIMLSEWVWRVREGDQILHLGDVFMGKQGNPKRWAAILSRMPGEKYLIKGNHDKATDALYELAGFTIIDPFVHFPLLFSHKPATVNSVFNSWMWETNIHGHIHGNVLGQNPADPEDDCIIPGKNYLNVSVEVTDFKPIALGNVYPV